VCCGAGGVGKTTTAAALGLRAAEQGRRVVVLTIDPARRLAQSLGLTELDNTPRAVAGIDDLGRRFSRRHDARHEAHLRRGRRGARTPEKAEQILANPFYVALSSSFAGTQEYMAMEKLGQLRICAADGRPRWDLIVVDTPPSRSALDFLDAPKRLGSFLDGRFIRLLRAPAKAGGRAYVKVVQAGMNLAASTIWTRSSARSCWATCRPSWRGARLRVRRLPAARRRRPMRCSRTPARRSSWSPPERDALREAGLLRETGLPRTGCRSPASIVNRMEVPQRGIRR
jgi:anion-transporting  ArsA/GET3 family ATPase